MLNEKLEFLSYVTNPKSKEPRLQPYYLTKSYGESCELNGIGDVLTVIARGFIFSCEEQIYTEDYLLNDKMVKATICILRRWCGFEEINQERRNEENNLVQNWFEKYPEADGWLKTYWMYHFKQGKKKKKTQMSCEELWTKYQAQWIKSFNSEYSYQSKKITYENVIADAITYGPLQERYFVFRKNDKKSKKKPFKYLYSIKEGTSNPQERTVEKMLKNIAAYLIWQELHPCQENGVKQCAVLFQKGLLLGWYGLDDTKGKTSIWYLDGLLWNERQIFTASNLYLDFVKFAVDEEYLKEFDFRLINKDEVEKYKAGYWILEDCGHGEHTLLPLEFANK